MTRDPRYDILFEPVRIGPVTARNRFYQVPHCTGIGWTQPETLARLRGIKAEGGWAVVSTEETEIHPTADCEPFHEGRLWDDRDIPAMALMAEAVHAHGALAAIEIMHHGGSVANWGTRLAPMAPSHRPIIYNYPVQARAMDKQDIRDLRGWHRDAALRSKKAGFDIVYVYATHDLSIAHQFLQRRKNDRIDEYGGSLENRARLLRELIEDTKDAVGDTCAVAVRFAADELIGDAGLTRDGEARDVVEMLAELPDLWDVNISTWPNDSQTSRFAKEGFQEEYTSWVKQVTTKPVVGVGRFTSPDTMVSASEARHPRLHRRGAALDRRSVPAEEDRGRADRRHPRVHRLQHLRVERLHLDQPALHPEPDDGRGMAARLAPRDHPGEEVGRIGAGGWCRTRGTRGGAIRGASRLRSPSRRSRRPSSAAA